MTTQVDRNEEIQLLTVLGDWSTAEGPLYRRLAGAIQRAVDEGALQAGAPLPAERRLAGLIAVSRATVVAAYDQLRGTGVIESRQGSGSRIAGTARATMVPGADGRVPGGSSAVLFQRLIDGPGEVLSLAAAAIAADPSVADALAEVARVDMPIAMATTGYSPHGLPALRQAIAALYVEAGVPTGANQIVVTTGAHQALSLIADQFLRPGARVVVESPSWPGCLDVLRARGATLVPVSVDEDGVRTNELAKVLAEGATDLVYLMPTYQNPTGAMLSPTRRRRVVELAAEYDVPLVADDALAGGNLGIPAAPPVSAFLAAAGRRPVTVLELGSLSKTIWGGLRVGWVRGPADSMARLARRKALADLGSPILDQLVAARMVPTINELIANRVTERKHQLALLESLLAEWLPTWRWHPPAGGLSLWIQLPGVDASVFAQVALRHGVEVIPGRAMDPSGLHDEFLRFPFCFPDEFLTEVVNRLNAAWCDLDRYGPCEARLAPVV
jgi:DNA-binding transcriptional MocR family regulator